MIAKAYWDDDRMKSAYASKSYLLRTAVYKIAKDLNFDSESEMGISEIKQIEKYLKEYQIMLLDWKKSKSVPVYLNSDAESKKYIYILLYQHHYYTIKSIAQFYECNRYCHRCKKQYSKHGWHKCESICM